MNDETIIRIVAVVSLILAGSAFGRKKSRSRVTPKLLSHRKDEQGRDIYTVQADSYRDVSLFTEGRTAPGGSRHVKVAPYTWEIRNNRPRKDGE
jgi:hypothetical protein